jgi:hypothetical protein
MAREFRKGTDLIKSTAENKGGKRKFTKNIYWKNGDVRTVAFVTAASDIPKVRLHTFVRIPDDRMESGFRYDTFLCRKDPSMVDETGGVCPLCDDVEHEATEKFMALAIELEATKEGKKVKELKVKYDTVKRDDGTEVEYPRWGVITQGAKNFFSYFAAYDEMSGDIREVAWEIQREGDSVGTKYHPFEVKAALPDLTEVIENMPELEDLLDEMGSDEKYSQVGELEAGSQPSFGGRKNSDSGTAPTGERASEFSKFREEVVGSY